MPWHQDFPKAIDSDLILNTVRSWKLEEEGEARNKLILFLAELLDADEHALADEFPRWSDALDALNESQDSFPSVPKIERNLEMNIFEYEVPPWTSDLSAADFDFVSDCVGRYDFSADPARKKMIENLSKRLDLEPLKMKGLLEEWVKWLHEQEDRLGLTVRPENSAPAVTSSTSYT